MKYPKLYKSLDDIKVALDATFIEEQYGGKALFMARNPLNETEIILMLFEPLSSGNFLQPEFSGYMLSDMIKVQKEILNEV